MLQSTWFSCFEPANLYDTNARTIHIIRPEGPCFISGHSRKYSENYKGKVTQHLSQNDFHQIINEINDIGHCYFPCLPAILIGYGLFIFTLGLSLVIPWYSILDLNLPIVFVSRIWPRIYAKR